MNSGCVSQEEADEMMTHSLGTVNDLLRFWKAVIRGHMIGTLCICETSFQVHFFSPPANYSKLVLQLENHLSMKIKCSKSSEMWPRGKSKRPQR